MSKFAFLTDILKNLGQYTHGSFHVSHAAGFALVRIGAISRARYHRFVYLEDHDEFVPFNPLALHREARVSHVRSLKEGGFSNSDICRLLALSKSSVGEIINTRKGT